MKGKSLAVLLFAFALAPTCLPAKEKILRYEITDLGTLGGVASQATLPTDFSSQGHSINNSGQVAGLSDYPRTSRHRRRSTPSFGTTTKLYPSGH